ncbi:MAG TPA: energy transducer TonB [Allosphingosinicella sp.]|jgi:hypothetical protein
MDGFRLYSLAASLAGTLGQLGTIAALEPSLRQCLCGPIGEHWSVVLGAAWQPYIDNPGLGARPSSDPRCPGNPSAGPTFRLDHAPLPAAFDPQGDPGRDVLACVRLRGDGSVAAVRIVAGTGRPRMDRRLLRVIHREWRFRPADGPGGTRSWQRVRLSSFQGGGPTTMEIGLLPL